MNERIVLINSWYKKYSTGKLVYEFKEYLEKQGCQTLTFYGHGENVSEDNVIRTVSQIGLYVHGGLSRLTGYQGCYSHKETEKVIQQIEDFKPTKIYLFNLHAYYLDEFCLLSYLKQKKYKVVYMLFDEYAYLGRCCFAGDCEKFVTQCEKCSKIHEYPQSLLFDRSKFFFDKKKKIYENWEELTFAGVEFLANQAKRSGIAKNVNFRVLDMGVQLNKIYYPRDTRQLHEKLGISDETKVVLTVGPYSDPRKGIKKFFEIAKMCENEDIKFINVGFDGNNKELPGNGIGIGYVSNQDELAQFYSLADIYAMTSSGEAMSLTCMEALGCGTRIVGFNISGTPYAAVQPYGAFVEYNNLDEFKKVIVKTPKKDDDFIQQCRQYALSRYEISDYVKNLADI